MGKVIRGQRKGYGHGFKARTHKRKGASGMRRRDITERHARIKGVVRKIVHDPGRGAPMAIVEFKCPIKSVIPPVSQSTTTISITNCFHTVNGNKWEQMASDSNPRTFEMQFLIPQNADSSNLSKLYLMSRFPIFPPISRCPLSCFPRDPPMAFCTAFSHFVL